MKGEVVGKVTEVKQSVSETVYYSKIKDGLEIFIIYRNGEPLGTFVYIDPDDKRSELLSKTNIDKVRADLIQKLDEFIEKKDYDLKEFYDFVPETFVRLLEESSKFKRYAGMALLGAAALAGSSALANPELAKKYAKMAVDKTNQYIGIGAQKAQAGLSQLSKKLSAPPPEVAQQLKKDGVPLSAYEKLREKVASLFNF